jgi:signal transduction histidine kinase
MIKDLPIATKLLLLVLVPLAITLVVTLVLTITGLSRLNADTSTAKLLEEQQIINHEFAQLEANLLVNIGRLSSDTALFEAVQRGDAGAVQGLLLATVVRSPELSHLQVVDLEGQTLGAKGAFEVGDTPLELDKFNRLGLIGIEATDLVPTDQGWLLSIVRPLKSPAGPVVGALSVGRLLDASTLFVLNFERTNPRLVLFDAQGQISAVSGGNSENDVKDNVVVDRALWEQASQGETGFDSAKIQGDWRQVLVAPLMVNNKTAAVFGLVLSTTAAVNLRDQLVIASLAAIALLALLSTLGTLALGRTFIIRPVATLLRSAEQIAAGQLEAVTPGEVSRDEFGKLATAFNHMAVQLRDLVSTLEERVQERTQALEISAEISRQVTGILDRDELLKYVVNRLRDQFNFYHTHLYLVEEETGDLIMVEGSGEVGQKLKARGHRLIAGQGIVGTVASTKQSFLSNNVNNVLNFVRNPLLPETNSELAVPLRKGDQILGVLDIQSEQLNRFMPEDVSLMQSIADQTAVALDNARLLVQSQQAVQEVERLNRRLTREAWTQTRQEMSAAGYRFSSGVSQAITNEADGWLPPMKEAVVKKQLVKQSAAGNGDSVKAELAVPLTLRGQVIGVLGVKREERPDWAEEEVSAVTAVADQISRALENARLSKEQEKTIEQLKEIDRLKSEFLTSMSHELRTPLNSIIGFADVLVQGIDGELPDLAMNDIKLIHNSGQHLLALINDILDLSKIEAGKLELVREPLDVAEVIDDVLAASTSLVKSKPVQIKVDKSESLPLIYADKLRLSQVLLNLMSNAAKFTERGGITIKAHVDEHAPGKLRIAVVDTGIGIAEEKLEAIFDRFRQADSSTTRKYGGTGLGLAIALNLTEMHGGELKVKSQVGVGSEFYFTVPLADGIE